MLTFKEYLSRSQGLIVALTTNTHSTQTSPTRSAWLSSPGTEKKTLTPSFPVITLCDIKPTGGDSFKLTWIAQMLTSPWKTKKQKAPGIQEAKIWLGPLELPVTGTVAQLPSLWEEAVMEALCKLQLLINHLKPTQLIFLWWQCPTRKESLLGM